MIEAINTCPGNLPSADAGRPDSLPTDVSNLLHIFEADKTGIFFHQMTKRGETSLAIKKPIVLNTTPPNLCRRLWHTSHSSCLQAKKEAERVGKLHAAKSNRKIFRYMSKLPLNSDESPRRLLSRFHGIDHGFVTLNNIASSKDLRSRV